MIAVVLFATLSVLLMAAPTRAVWISGAALQVVVLVMYVVVSAERVPAFEEWGITLKVLQAGLLVALVWLLVFDDRARRDVGAAV